MDLLDSIINCIFTSVKQKTSIMIKVSTYQEFRTDREGLRVTGDCAVRAFAVFFDCSYATAREWLNKYNFGKDSINGTRSMAIGKAMTEYGKTRGIQITEHLPSRRIKVKSLVAQEEKAYITARGHATACMNGVHYSNVTNEEAAKGWKDDANQFVKRYFTMKIVDLDKYLTGGVI